MWTFTATESPDEITLDIPGKRTFSPLRKALPLSYGKKSTSLVSIILLY
jgi:hypothetical protein